LWFLFNAPETKKASRPDRARGFFEFCSQMVARPDPYLRVLKKKYRQYDSVR
jgi:hypothetical protein